jgi:hypothetical protein
MCVRLALLLALVLTVGMTRGAVAGLWVATPTPQPTGSISGMAIDDENGNGVIDPGEPGLAGWEIFLTTGEKAQVAADGSYRFVGVPPGTYTVSLVAAIGGAGPPPPWIPTIPDASLRYEVSLAAGQNVENADFAIQLLDEAAVLWGEIIIDAAPAPDGTVVQALTGNTVCDEYTLGVGSSSGVWGPIIPPGRAPNTITVVVPSANEKAGCGTEGATITFLINGRPANETEPWYSGSHSVWMLTTGPPFAWYSGGVPVDSDYKVAAYVGDTLCSNQFPRIGWSYAVAVFSAELKPGCGTPGATVRFMIGEAQAEQTAQWSPGRHELNLTTSAASISGMAIEDKNGNGVIEPGEPALVGFKVAIAGTQNETLPAADGSYRFVGVRPGDYSVRLFWVEGGPPAPWYPTLPGPELSYEISLGPGENVKDIDFAVQLLPEAAVFSAAIMVDAAAAPPGTLVQALIGDTICDESAVGGWSPRSGGLGFATGTAPNTILVVVPSANEKAGCGTEGATITFRINGQPANETEVWHTSGSGRTTLTTGPPFATYHGTVRLDGTDIHGSDVTGYIDDTPCSTDYGSLLGTYHIIVLPAELKPGCGTHGATVRFMFGEAQAAETALWTPGSHELNLTAAAAAPTETPIPTPTASATPRSTPSTAPPTPRPATAAPTASATPFSSGADLGGDGSSDSGVDWWPFALAAGLVAALSGGGLLVWARRRARQPK